MNKSKKFSIYLIATIMVIFGSAFTSCTKETDETLELNKKELKLNSSLPTIFMIYDGSCPYLAFESKEQLEQYESFIEQIVNDQNIDSLLKTYKIYGFEPLYLNNNNNEEATYYDIISKLLLNKNCTISVGGELVYDKGNNFINMPKTIGHGNASYTDGTASAYAYSNMTQAGYYSFTLHGELKYSKPFWSNKYRVTITTKSYTSNGVSTYPSSALHHHYCEYDLIVDGVLKNTPINVSQTTSSFETVVVSGKSIQWGYCYATVQSNDAVIYLRME
jgi:hypothetical protein